MAKHIHIHLGDVSGKKKSKDADILAINKRTALKMFWEAGFDSEQGLKEADAILSKLKQPSAGYYNSVEVSAAIRKASSTK